MRKISILFLLAVTTIVPLSGYSFGKKQPTPTEPADTQAFPTRILSFDKFLETPFLLPDGKTRVDMAALLPEIMVTEIGQATNKLRSRGTSNGGETPDRFVLRGGITSFEANNFTNGIRIGYKPGVGDIGNGKLTGIEGGLSYTIGSLTMDFNIFDNERKEVVAVGSGSGIPVSGNVNVTIDFSKVTTGADFVFRSPMAPLFRAAAREAIKKIVEDPKTNFLMDWGAKVVRTNTDTKKVTFNSGSRDAIEANNLFRMYDENDSFMGVLKVRDVDLEQCSATIKDDASDHIFNQVKAGDAVRIHFLSIPK